MKKLRHLLATITTIFLKLTKSDHSIITKKFPYCRLSVKDKISEKLKDYFNMSGLVNPVFSTDNSKVVKFSQPFDRFQAIPGTYESPDGCVLKDQYDGFGALLLCDDQKYMLIDDSKHGSKRVLPIPSPKENITQIYTCKSAFFAHFDGVVKGAYFFCNVNNISPEPETENELTSYLFYYDFTAKVFQGKEILNADMDFSKDIESVFLGPTKGSDFQFLLYPKENNKANVLYYFRSYNKKIGPLDVSSIFFTIKPETGAFIIKNIFSIPKNLNLEGDYIVIGFQQKNPIFLLAYIVDGDKDSGQPTVIPLGLSKIMRSKNWGYFFDEKFTYEINIFEENKLFRIDITQRSNLELIGSNIADGYSINFEEILVEEEPSEIRFFSNKFGVVLDFYVGNKIKYEAYLDKNLNNVNFSIVDDDFYLSSLWGQTVAKFQKKNSYLYKLGDSEMLVDASAALQKGKSRNEFSLNIVLEFGYRAEDRRVTLLELNGEVIGNLEEYLNIDKLKSIQLDVYNKVPINLPIDISSIKGSNIDFQLENTSEHGIVNLDLINELTGINLKDFSEDCELLIVEQWLLYISTNEEEAKRQVEVYEIKDIKEDGFQLEKKSKNPFMFEKSIGEERVIKYSKQGKYLVLITFVGNNKTPDHYNIYIAYDPNFVNTVYSFKSGLLEFEMIPDSRIQNSKMIKLYVLDINRKSIDIYNLNAESKDEPQKIKTLNKDVLGVEFCPVVIQRGNITPDYLLVGSQCGSVRVFYVIDIHSENIVWNQNINYNFKGNYMMCLFHDQVLIKPLSYDLLFGTKLSYFDNNIVDYVNPISIEQISDLHCSKSSKITLIKKVDESLISYLILKAPNSHDFDSRIYKLVGFETSRFEKVRAYEFQEGFIFFAKPHEKQNDCQWKVYKLKLDGPLFELTSSYDESFFYDREQTIPRELNFRVSSKKKIANFKFDFTIHKTELHPFNITLKGKSLYTNFSVIDEMMKIDGHVYGMKIEPTTEYKAKMDKNLDSNFEIKYYDITKTVKLSAKMRFEIDYTSKCSDHILGYHIYNGEIYIFDNDLNYLTRVDINYRCSMGDHSTLQNGYILIVLGCKVENALLLLTYLVNIKGSPEQIKPSILGNYTLGHFTNVKVYAMQENNFLLRVDYEDMKSVSLMKYTLDIRNSDQIYEELKVFQTLINCKTYFLLIIYKVQASLLLVL